MHELWARNECTTEYTHRTWYDDVRANGRTSNEHLATPFPLSRCSNQDRARFEMKTARMETIVAA